MSRMLLLVGAALAFWPAVATAQTPELSTTDRLEDRRYVAAGDRGYVMGFQDGSFQAQGWHIGGEMGGVTSQPLKLLDGLWFAVDGEWVGPATRFHSGWGYVRFDLPETGGLQLARTDFAPDGVRGAVVGLHLTNRGAARAATIAVDVRSELLYQYPWDWTTPSAAELNGQDSASFDAGAGVLDFRDTSRSADGLDLAAAVGSNRPAAGGQTGPGHWGAQAPPEPCEDAGKPDDEKAFTCDDGAAGRGTGGQLRYEIDLPAGATRTLWIGVGGSHRGPASARRALAETLRDPGGSLATKRAGRERQASWTQLSLPGDPLLAEGIEWGKQNLLDSVQVAEGLEIRDVDEGRAYPPPAGRMERARWLGAGFPDYPWLFATDGEFTAFAAVTVGQFAAIKDHADALREASLILNGDSGKVVHEVVGDGSVYFGALHHPGNTDETAKFPSMVALIWRWTGDDAFRDRNYAFARRNLEYVFAELDADGDGWPEGLGNVERSGMGDEKLDVTVATIRGLYDLADMARAKGDGQTFAWARNRAREMHRAFEAQWWMPGFRQYADSLRNPGNEQVQQRHWIGVTPMEVELVRKKRVRPGLAVHDHGVAALEERETPCYSGTRPYNEGLFHTGCGGGPEGEGEFDIFSLNTAVMAVGEGNYGRLGDRQQRRYTDANRELMLPVADEQPGAMPEIAPSPPPRGRNIDRCTRCRSMVLQAWGNYGTMWPVVHQQLGVRPDMGRGRLEVVPQLPSAAPIAGRRIRLGSGYAHVSAGREGKRYRTTVDTATAPVRRLRIGHTLPHGSRVRAVRLDGRRAGFQKRATNRGLEVTVKTRPGRHTLEVVAR